MRFNSLVYFGFLAVVVAVLWLLPVRARKAWLLVASCVFYGSWHAPFLGLLLTAATLNHLGARWIVAATDRHRRGTVVIAANLLLLAVFKYADWALSGVSGISTWLGGPAVPLPGWVLPLGISFYLFECISYTVDLVRKRETLHPFFDFLLFIAYFPKLIAGPILRAKEFLPQLAKHRPPDAASVRTALRELLIGLFLKVVIADGLSQGVDAAFSKSPASLGVLDVWVMAIGFGLQIYFDFSSYSRMAIGSARLCGIELVENFNHPYVARSPADFWARWHMSLSRWIRDYVFYPLVGRKTSLGAMVRAALGSMLLCGLWHGAGWGYVLWGLAHGLLVAGYHVMTFSGRGRPPVKSAVRSLIGAVVTFAGVSLAWLLFRAPSAADGFALLGRALSPLGHLNRALSGTFYLEVFLVTLAVWSAPWVSGRLESGWSRLQTRPRRLAFAAGLEGLAWGLLFAVSLVYLRGQTAFIYFQF
ncbi:MAG: MBOAT family protein [Myxococcaceae bacterium]|nr:MBOAT family protein [Myxococcaceae bacterium]